MSYKYRIVKITLKDGQIYYQPESCLVSFWKNPLKRFKPICMREDSYDGAKYEIDRHKRRQTAFREVVFQEL